VSHCIAQLRSLRQGCQVVAYEFGSCGQAVAVGLLPVRGFEQCATAVGVVSGMMGLRVRDDGLVREEAGVRPEGDVDERHEDRYFDERADDTGQCLP
jgi:hypothetical protein